MRRLVVILAAILSAAALIGCSPGPSGESYLYVVGPMTGDMASRGQEVAGGARLRAEEINLAGGLNGRRVVIRSLDDGGDEEMAVDAAGEVAAAVKKGEPVVGVVGHYNSGATGPALDRVYKDLNVVVVTPGSSNPELTQKGYSRFFRVVSTDAIQGPVDARKALELGWKRIAVLHTDNLYAKGLSGAFLGELRKRGAPPVIDLEMRYNDLGVYLRTLPDNVKKVLAANPDGVFFAGDYPEAIPLVETLRDAGYRGPIMAGDSVVEYEFIDQLGSRAEGVILSNILPEMSAVASEAWKNGYRGLEKRSPGMDSIMGYAAAQVILEGAKRANSLKGEAVASEMRKLEMKTILGDWAVDGKGDLRDQKIYLYQVKSGSFVQIGLER